MDLTTFCRSGSSEEMAQGTSSGSLQGSFSAREMSAPQELVELGRKLARQKRREAIVKYLDQHKDVNAVFLAPGRPHRDHANRSSQYSKKYFGNFIFDNRYELMNKAATFPGDLWRLAEERVVEPLSWVDRVRSERSGRDQFRFRVGRETGPSLGRRRLSARTSFHVSASSHWPFPLFVCRLSGVHQEIQSPLSGESNGVFAGTSNHTGSFPRMEVHVKDGYVREVKGGGTYGDLWREFMKYPKINE